MALTESKPFTLGSKAPTFRLQDSVSSRWYTLDELKGERATCVMFICNHCPYVKHVLPQILALSNRYMPQGISFIAISSNDPVSYPEDGPEKMKELAQAQGFAFPYLFDETQQIARAYGAVCTPEFYVFDSKLIALYHGRLDDSTPKQGTLTGKDLQEVFDLIIAGKPVAAMNKPSRGCSIKWKQ